MVAHICSIQNLGNSRFSTLSNASFHDFKTNAWTRSHGKQMKLKSENMDGCCAR
jgi:hypothetical protein